MPHVSDVQPTSHADHDALLVAALAAGDLAGTDRDHATALIETCPDCMTLHDDLVAIARATAVVPPPIATRPRDFRLTREQAARLRPSGWRRAVGAFAGPRLAFTRPLGITLTTIGLAGLLITNIPIGLGSSAGAAATAAMPASRDSSSDVTSESVPSGGGNPGTVPVPAASSGQFGAAASAAAASAAPAPVTSAPAVRDQGVGSAVSPAGGTPGLVAGVPQAQASAQPSAAGYAIADGAIERPAPMDWRTFFVAAVLVGLGLLVLRRVGRWVAPA
jgi:hypothetical protein